MSDELNKWLSTVVANNQRLNFVQRIQSPDKWPTLDLGNGNYATHKMAWGTFDDKPVVYPLVIYDPQTKALRELSPEDAANYAKTSKEYLTFPDARSADIFSREYKRLWEKK